MPTMSIKNVPANVVDSLRRRAARNRRSMQGELMALICQAVAAQPEDDRPLSARPARRGRHRGHRGESTGPLGEAVRPCSSRCGHDPRRPRCQVTPGRPAPRADRCRTGWAVRQTATLVADCSVLASVLFDEPDREAAAATLRGHELFAPDLVDHEFVSVAVKK